MKNGILLAGLFCLLAPAVVFDLRWRLIPNRLVAAGALLGLLLALLQGGPLALGAALLALLTAFSLSFPLWLCGWLGGGDVKLLAAVAPFTGLAGLPALLAGTAFAGLLLALGTLLYRRLLAPAMAPSAASPPSPPASPPRLPYAVAIAAGAGVALLQASFGFPA